MLCVCFTGVGSVCVAACGAAGWGRVGTVESTSSGHALTKEKGTTAVPPLSS